MAACWRISSGRFRCGISVLPLFPCERSFTGKLAPGVDRAAFIHHLICRVLLWFSRHIDQDCRRLHGAVRACFVLLVASCDSTCSSIRRSEQYDCCPVHGWCEARHCGFRLARHSSNRASVCYKSSHSILLPASSFALPFIHAPPGCQSLCVYLAALSLLRLDPPAYVGAAWNSC